MFYGERRRIAALAIDRVHVCHFDAQFAQMGAEEFIKVLYEQLFARFVLIGDDFRFGNGRVGDFALMEKIGTMQGFTVQAVHSVKHDGVRVSSTAVRAARSGSTGLAFGLPWVSRRTGTAAE